MTGQVIYLNREKQPRRYALAHHDNMLGRLGNIVTHVPKLWEHVYPHLIRRADELVTPAEAVEILTISIGRYGQSGLLKAEQFQALVELAPALLDAIIPDTQGAYEAQKVWARLSQRFNTMLSLHTTPEPVHS